MPEYKTLREMKVKRPDQIDRYSVQSVDNTDVLRIVYKRKKGSFLPDSKRFRFPRIKKTSLEDSGRRKIDVRWEVSPFLQKAVSELDHILDAEISDKRRRAIILEELSLLQQDAAHRIDYIRSLIEEE
ncbi:MAG: DUF3461 family protein [bacterium]|nr:DUF3461 family protein [bacterium]